MDNLKKLEITFEEIDKSWKRMYKIYKNHTTDDEHEMYQLILSSLETTMDLLNNAMKKEL